MIPGNLVYVVSDTESLPEQSTTARTLPGLDPELACIFSTFAVRR